MSDVKNPTPWSDYDFLEFVSFCWKVDGEGFTYAYDNYSPDFEAAELQAVADDMGKTRALYRQNEHLVREWWDTVGGQAACDMQNAHVDEARQRERDACLWGVRCTDGYVIHEQTEQLRDATVERLLSDPRWRKPATLLRRELPGGDWSETPIA